jgi:hypothetical protein
MIEVDRKAMINALYANGMIGGEDLMNEMKSINGMFNKARLAILEVEEMTSDLDNNQEFDEAPELLTKVGLSGTNNDQG